MPLLIVLLPLGQCLPFLPGKKHGLFYGTKKIQFLECFVKSQRCLWVAWPHAGGGPWAAILNGMAGVEGPFPAVGHGGAGGHHQGAQRTLKGQSSERSPGCVSVACFLVSPAMRKPGVGTGGVCCLLCQHLHAVHDRRFDSQAKASDKDALHFFHRVMELCALSPVATLHGQCRCWMGRRTKAAC
jgi:hypothetical protein